MKDMESNGKGRLVRRFREAVDGPIIRRLYAKMPTSELARRLGLTEKQVKNFVYRENVEQWARKDAATLSRINSEKGRKGGRPRKKK
jgi:predicted transcriptional regulator